MRYLLDVNALIALGHTGHVFHVRVTRWVTDLSRSTLPQLSTCSITELGFVRIVSHVYGSTVEQSRTLLSDLKERSDYEFIFIADDQGAAELPSWVTSPKQTTDGHLSELATAHGFVLATLDENIPGSYLIP